jgi:hypothetical protein
MTGRNQRAHHAPYVIYLTLEETIQWLEILCC